MQAEILAWCWRHNKDSVNGSSICSFVCLVPKSLFDWLPLSNQACSHRALWPQALTQQMSENPAQDWLFHLNEAHHLAWMLSPWTSSSPWYFYCPLWPLSSGETQKACGAHGSGALQPPSICQASWGLPKQPADASLLSSCGGELASLCPSTQ